MAHRLNTNKQLLIGNGILAFCRDFCSCHLCLHEHEAATTERRRTQLHRDIHHHTDERICRDSTSIFINDSLLVNRTIAEEPFTIEVKRFAEQNALMIVNNATEKLSLFELSEKGGEYRFEKEGEEVKQLAKN